MKEIWNRIENWLRDNAPEILADLEPGASDTEIKEAEEYLKVSFPEHMKASLKIHNGQKGESSFLIDGWQLLPLEKIMEEWDAWADLIEMGDFEGIRSYSKGQIKNDWWNPKWIPLTFSGEGDHYCLDLDPDQGGKAGQIIITWHDMPNRDLVADSYKEWLEQFAADLEADKYIIAPEYDGLVLKDNI
jgi:cell wall assembly regulator SMI1